MGYGSVEFREVGRTPIYDDEFSFDHRAGFGLFEVITNLRPRVPVTPTAPATGVSPGSPQIGVAPVPLPPPIMFQPMPGEPQGKPISAQTTVGAPISPTVAQNPPTVTTGTDGGGTAIAQSPTQDGGFGQLMEQAKNPLVIGGLLFLGLLALRRSGGTRRWL